VAASLDSLSRAEEISVEDYLGQWLTHAARRVRPKMLDGYLGLIRLYASPDIGGIRLAELGSLEVQGL
jgi:hypothetical protein